MTLKVIREIEYDHDPDNEDEAPALRGYPITSWAIVQDVPWTTGATARDEQPEFQIAVACPCCETVGSWTGSVKCPGGGEDGCEHEVEVECDTCNGHGWCVLRPEGGGDQYAFTGYDDVEVIKVPKEIVTALERCICHADPAQGRLDLPHGDKNNG